MSDDIYSDPGADPIDTETIEVVDVAVGEPDPDATDVIDGELIDDDNLDGPEWSSSTGLALFDDPPDPDDQATVTVEDVSDLPKLGDEFAATPRVTSDSGPASAGVGGGLGGGKLTSKCRKCRQNPCVCRRGRGTGGGGGGSGAGGGRHFSILGGLHLFSGNRADASVLRAGPIASPQVTGIKTGGGRRSSSPRRFW